MMKSRGEDTVMVKRFLRPVLLGVCVGALVCVVVLLLLAVLLTVTDIPKAAVTPMAVAAAGIGAFFGGLTAGALAKEKGWLFGLTTGAVLYLLIFLMALPRLPEVSGSYALIKLLILIGCGAVGGMVGVNTRRR